MRPKSLNIRAIFQSEMIYSEEATRPSIYSECDAIGYGASKNETARCFALKKDAWAFQRTSQPYKKKKNQPARVYVIGNSYTDYVLKKVLIEMFFG